MKYEVFTARDKKEIHLAIWDDTDSPRGVIQIAHGMAEHMGRYDDFACFLNKNGYIVAGDDHRAHGKTSCTKLGHDEGDITLLTVSDEREITDMLIDRYKLPVILLGHSYGSFLAQEYIIQGTEKLSGVILSGSAYQGGLITKLGKMMAKNKCRKNSLLPGETFANMTFRAYDKKLKDGKNAWLTRDRAIVDKYNNDEFSGFTCSNAFYKSMLNMCGNLYNKKRLSAIDKNLKLFIAAGSQDPVGASGKLVIKLANMYTKLGMKNMELRLYEGARHEILNETNRKEVYNDILSFADDCIKI